MLHDWTSFFVVTGAAGAQLVGLLFVGVTLVTGLSATQAVSGIRAFMTPTLINFASVFFQALAVLTPQSTWLTGLSLVLLGFAGIAYGVHAIRLRRGLDFVSLSGLNWLPYNTVPLIANASLVAGGIGLMVGWAFAPGAIAAASALLLLAGMYGAWDLTVWLIQMRGDR